MNKSIKLSNLKMLQFTATQLGELCQDVVFLGGCTTALLITDIASPDVRYTLDVDCIVDVISLNQYHQFEKKLLKKGFKKSMQDDVICRWHYDDATLDVMPTDENILGFSNCWYKYAIQNPSVYSFSDDVHIKVVTAPYFLATKLEAFKARGHMDYLASHDFEDIISVIDGRKELVDDVKKSENELQQYLAKIFGAIFDSRAFHDALPGHFMQYGDLAEERIILLKQNIEKITQYV